MSKSLTLNLDLTTETSGNAEQVAQLIGAAAWHISGDYLVVENCTLSYRVTDNETYASVGMTKIPNGETVELWEGEQPISYDLGHGDKQVQHATNGIDSENWQSIPTFQILPFIVGTRFDYDADNKLYLCVIKLADSATIIMAAEDVEAAHANALNAIKEMAHKNGWLSDGI